MSYAIAYLRYRTGEERRTPPGRFPPLADTHPLIEDECAHCGNCFVAGDVVTLVAIGPDSLDQAAAADAGHWYSAAAFPVHQHCAWPNAMTAIANPAWTARPSPNSKSRRVGSSPEGPA